MSPTEYLNLDIIFSPSEDDGYSVLVRAPNDLAENRTSFELPFSPDAVGEFRQGFISHIRGLVGRDFNRTMPLRPDTFNASKRAVDVGRRLFLELFKEQNRSVLDRSLEAAMRDQKGLRLRLQFDEEVGDLARLPWEFLHEQSDFLAFSHVRVSIVRFLMRPGVSVPLQVDELPLKVLVIVAAPNDVGQLDVTTEQQAIDEGLADLTAQQLVEVTHLTGATLDKVRQKLSQESFHIVHFIGHGDVDDGTGGLVFEKADGSAEFVGSELIGRLFRGQKVVVLNACRGAETVQNDFYAGVANRLIDKGVPAVVAMQFRITDLSAKQFAREFYRSLAKGEPVDGCLYQTRDAILFQSQRELRVEWGTPALFMRSATGVVFQIPSQEQIRQAKIEQLSAETIFLVEKQRYPEAKTKLDEIITLQIG